MVHRLEVGPECGLRICSIDFLKVDDFRLDEGEEREAAILGGQELIVSDAKPIGTKLAVSLADDQNTHLALLDALVTGFSRSVWVEVSNFTVLAHYGMVAEFLDCGAESVAQVLEIGDG